MRNFILAASAAYPTAVPLTAAGQVSISYLKDGVEKDMIKKDDVLNYVSSRDFDVLVVLGAGNLDNYVPQIAKIIESK